MPVTVQSNSDLGAEGLPTHRVMRSVLRLGTACPRRVRRPAAHRAHQVLLAASVMVAVAALAVGWAGAGETPPAAAPGETAPGAALAGLSPEDIQVLRQTRGFLETLVADDNENEEMRAVCLAALNRVHEALNDWGRPGLEDWYLGLLVRTRSGRLQGLLLAGGQLAAQGGRYHLGGVREFWRKVDAKVADQGKELSSQAERMRRDFLNRAATFDKPPRIVPNVKPLALQARRLNMGSQVKPYPEPKPEKPPK